MYTYLFFFSHESSTGLCRDLYKYYGSPPTNRCHPLCLPPVSCFQWSTVDELNLPPQTASCHLAVKPKSTPRWVAISRNGETRIKIEGELKVSDD